MNRHWKIVQWASIAVVTAVAGALWAGWYIVAITLLSALLLAPIVLMDAWPADEPSSWD